jgi:hypothetical protein
MNRTAALLTITVLSSLATPFVVQAMTPASRDAQSAPAATAVVTAATPAEPSCARKVKVVYAGYGEGAGRSCTVEARTN